MSTLAADATSARLVTLYSELLSRVCSDAQDPQDGDGTIVVCDGVTLAHVDGDGDAHPIAGLGALVALSLKEVA